MDIQNLVIEVVDSEERVLSTFDLFHQLRPHLKRAEFVQKVRGMQMKHNYKIVVVFMDQSPVAAAGFRVTDSLAWGKCLCIDDLIVDEDHRRHGCAKALWIWLTRVAKENDCEQMHLDSGVHRHDAHKFYLRHGMDITCHHFQVPMM